MSGDNENRSSPPQIERRRAPKGRPPIRRPKKSIRLDRVHPADFSKYKLAFYCEDCCHFDATNRRCSMGFQAQHTRDEMMKLYELTGALAMCRALEID